MYFLIRNTLLFSTAVGLMVKLLATYSYGLPNPKIKNFGNLEMSSVVQFMIHSTMIITNLRSF